MKISKRYITHSWPVVVAVLPFILLQCIDAPLSPLAPSSDIQLSIPLVDVTRTASDMFSKNTSTVKYDSLSSGYYFQDTPPSQPTSIGLLQVQPTSSAQQVTVGKISVDSVAPSSQSVKAGFSVTVPGFLTFPESSIVAPGGPLDFSAQFDFLAIDTGSLSLTIANSLPLDIVFPQPITLQNNSTTPPDVNVIATFAFDTVRTGQSVTRVSSLAAKTLRGNLKTQPVTIKTLARNGPFTINSTDSISFGFSSTKILVNSAAAVIPDQIVTSVDSAQFSVDDSVVVSDAFFRGGTFTAAIINNLGITVGVYLKFDEFKSTRTPGQSFLINRNINGKDSLVLPINMDTLSIQTGASNVGTRLTYSLGISTINSGGAKQTVAATDFVRGEIRAGAPFSLKSVTGRIKPTTLAINSGSSGLSLGEAAFKFKVDSVKFDSVKIALKLGISGGYPIDYNLRLLAMNRKVTPAKIDSLFVPPASISSPNTFFTINPGPNQFTSIVLDNSAGLSAFLQRLAPAGTSSLYLPDSFIVRGSVVLNKGFVSGTIDDTTKVYSSVDTYFPLKLGIAGGELVEIAAVAAGADKSFTDAVKSGRLNFEFTNRLPIEFTFGAAMFRHVTPGGPRDTVLTIPTDNVPRIVQAATVDGNGNATTPAISVFQIGLVGADMNKFSLADSIAIKLDVSTSNNGAAAVRIRSSDYIRIRASGNMVYTLNKPK
ncbi:MAG: hypothetical protein WBD36_14630 [Bacteroidota bacterium]